MLGVEGESIAALDEARVERSAPILVVEAGRPDEDRHVGEPRASAATGAPSLERATLRTYTPPMRGRPLALAILAVILAACGGTPGPSSAPSTAASAASASGSSSTDLVSDVDVGGRTMHLVC